MILGGFESRVQHSGYLVQNIPLQRKSQEINMGTDAALDFDTDMQTIRNYVSAVVETKAKIATAYTAALDNVQTTFQTASPAEARPDILGVPRPVRHRLRLPC
jgi:hypothetical protein